MAPPLHIMIRRGLYAGLVAGTWFIYDRFGLITFAKKVMKKNKAEAEKDELTSVEPIPEKDRVIDKLPPPSGNPSGPFGPPPFQSETNTPLGEPTIDIKTPVPGMKPASKEPIFSRLPGGRLKPWKVSIGG